MFTETVQLENWHDDGKRFAAPWPSGRVDRSPPSSNLSPTERPLFGPDCFRLNEAVGNVLSLTTQKTPSGERVVKSASGKGSNYLRPIEAMVDGRKRISYCDGNRRSSGLPGNTGQRLSLCSGNRRAGINPTTLAGYKDVGYKGWDQ